MKKVISIALVLALAVTCLCACSASKKIIGTWNCTDESFINTSITFKEDGTAEVDGTILGLDLGTLGSILSGALNGLLNTTYTIEKNTLTINYNNNPAATYTVAFSGDTLTLTSTDGTVYHYVKAAA